MENVYYTRHKTQNKSNWPKWLNATRAAFVGGGVRGLTAH